MKPAARITDMHTCPLADPKPHIGGPIITGEPTVLIGFLPAARIGDKLTCIGPPDVIAMGSPTVITGYMMQARIGDATVHGGVIVAGCPTVLVGESGGGGGGGGAGAGGALAGAGPNAAAPNNLILEGGIVDQALLTVLVERIRNAGPDGRAFIERLESAPTPTRLSVGTTATDANGRVINLANTGGGVTLRPTESQSGDNEVHINPDHLINYNGTDGATHQETPEGLLTHEMGHADLLNEGDPAQTTGGPAAEQNVRDRTNPIREELGMEPEAD